MKKIIFLLAILFSALTVSAEDSQFVRNGNNFTKTYTVRSSKDTQTEFTYTIGDSIYNIWITPKGRCYIIRVSRNGKEYKQYLCEEIARQICEALGVEYVEAKQSE